MAVKYTKIYVKEYQVIFVSIDNNVITVASSEKTKLKKYKDEDVAIRKFGEIQDELIRKGFVEQNKRNFS